MPGPLTGTIPVIGGVGLEGLGALIGGMTAAGLLSKADWGRTAEDLKKTGSAMVRPNVGHTTAPNTVGVERSDATSVSRPVTIMPITRKTMTMPRLSSSVMIAEGASESKDTSKVTSATPEAKDSVSSEEAKPSIPEPPRPPLNKKSKNENTSENKKKPFYKKKWPYAVGYGVGSLAYETAAHPDRFHILGAWDLPVDILFGRQNQTELQPVKKEANQPPASIRRPKPLSDEEVNQALNQILGNK